MSYTQFDEPSSKPVESVTIDVAQAVILTNLSYKTLKRLHDRGEQVGLIRVGVKVLFVRSKLVEWLESQLAVAV